MDALLKCPEEFLRARSAPRAGISLHSALLAVSLLIGCTQSQSEWQELTVSDAGFAILMRGQPHYARQSLDTPAGKMEAHLYSSDRPDAYFAVGYSDYPLALVLGGSREQLFAGVRDTWLRRIDGRITSSDDRVTAGGKYPGYAFSARGNVKGADTFLDARLYLVDQRLYQIIAMSRKGEVAQGVVNRYLNSFRLIDPAQVGSITVEPAAK
ncbi:MAG: hypothetical protein ACXWUB_01470 [Burkholderiales bacterium]